MDEITTGQQTTTTKENKTVMNYTFGKIGRTGLGAVALATVTFLATVRADAQQASGASATLYSHGDPTADEQYLLEKLNHARMDPVGEGQRLAAWLRLPQNASMVSYYQIDANRVIADFSALPVVPPLAFNADLIAAARAHSDDLAPHDGAGPNGDDHAGYDGSTAKSRVFASGFRSATGGDGFVSENFGPGNANLDEAHAAEMVDWGNADLGHRKNAMLGATNVNVVGIGLTDKPDSLHSAFPLVSTQDFGSPGVGIDRSTGRVVNANFPAYLLGVAYNDANGNGQYDAGEGLAGVSVTVDGGAYYAVSSTSGGYALPLVRADGSNVDGSVTVHMSGLPSGATQDATLAVATVSTATGTYRANVKWDAVSGQTVGSGPVDDPSGSTVTLSGGGMVSRSAHNAVKVMVHRPEGSDETQALDVPLAFNGTAVAGVDYKPLPATVTIPAGADSFKLKVKALAGGASDSTASLTIKVKKVKGADAKAKVVIMP